jgi:hypothetical protein
MLTGCLAQASFLKTLPGDKVSKIYTFVGEVADDTSPRLETLQSIRGTQVDGQYSANDQAHLQYDESGFYLDIQSLLSYYSPTLAESSI